ncbi:MAG TPA: AraC family transcriptional regulator [Bacteroidota bacterium]|nr:AraC family transcriptional regulator [Bacteroidota bacterium]
MSTAVGYRLTAGGSASRREYVARMNRVLDYIDAHLAEDLRLETLAALAHFSPWHFHRVFHAMVGETLNRFIARVRIERAMMQLRAYPSRSVTEIALDCGFSASQTFARAFREATGMTASEWRSSAETPRQGEHVPESKMRTMLGKNGNMIGNMCNDGVIATDDIAPDHQSIRSFAMSSTLPLNVSVQRFPEKHVAYVRHIGPYAGNEALFMDLFGRLGRWAGPRGLIGPQSEFITIYHDDPNITDQDKLRTSVCVTVPAGTPVDGEIGAMSIPAGSYAVARFEIDATQYGEAWDALCGNWLPDSGYEPADGPSFEIGRNDPSTHPERKHIVDICIPVRPAQG